MAIQFHYNLYMNEIKLRQLTDTTYQLIETNINSNVFFNDGSHSMFRYQRNKKLNLNSYINRTEVKKTIEILYDNNGYFRDLFDSIEIVIPQTISDIDDNLFNLHKLANIAASNLYSIAYLTIWLKKHLYIDSYTDEAEIIKLFDFMTYLFEVIADEDNFKNLDKELRSYNNGLEIIDKYNPNENDFSKMKIIKGPDFLNEMKVELENIIKILKYIKSGDEIIKFVIDAKKIMNKKTNTLGNKINSIENYLNLEKSTGIYFLEVISGEKLSDVIDEFNFLKKLRNFVFHPTLILDLFYMEGETKENMINLVNNMIGFVNISLFINSNKFINKDDELVVKFIDWLQRK